jgi:hypothetical protein
MTRKEKEMATATEGYVQAHTDSVRAETQTTVAEALLRVERSVTIQTRWIIGLMIGLSTALLAINVQIALSVTNP